MEYKILMSDEKNHLQKSFLSAISEIADIYFTKGVHDVLYQMATYKFHLIILIDIQGLEMTCKMIETLRILKKVPVLVITSLGKDERTLYVNAGADMSVAFDFIYLLASSSERVYTFNQIYQVVWKEYPHGDIVNMIRCMVKRIKKKLKAIDPDISDIIHNVRNIGYFFKINTDI